MIMRYVVVGNSRLIFTTWSSKYVGVCAWCLCQNVVTVAGNQTLILKLSSVAPNLLGYDGPRTDKYCQNADCVYDCIRYKQLKKTLG